MFSSCTQVEARSDAIEDKQVRTAQDEQLTAKKALKMLKQGNRRYVAGQTQEGDGADLRATLADQGQNPVAVVIGCADSRCPLETIFDMHPGDLFVLRNAGNACTHPKGSVVASTEYAVGALGTKLLLVLGHTKCGAMAGATKVMLSSAGGSLPKADETSLDKYLSDLAPVTKQAMQELPQGATADDIAAHAIKVNVFHTIRNLLEFSPLIREKVASGEVEVHGGIYEIKTGEVVFLGQPALAQAVRTANHEQVPAPVALEMLKGGNKRYAGGTSLARDGIKLRHMLSDQGQNPMAVVIGCSDSRCPLETLFDMQPGDLFVLRNAGNACTHRKGSIVASTEYAVGALGTKLILVLGHTKCGAMAGATKVMLSELTGRGKPATNSLETYLSDLAPIAKEAMSQVPVGASIDEIAAEAIKVNAFNTIQKLLEFSEAIRDKVATGEVEVHCGIYQIVSGAVEFLGQHPRLHDILAAPLARQDS